MPVCIDPRQFFLKICLIIEALRRVTITIYVNLIVGEMGVSLDVPWFLDTSVVVVDRRYYGWTGISEKLLYEQISWISQPLKHYQIKKLSRTTLKTILGWESYLCTVFLFLHMWSTEQDIGNERLTRRKLHIMLSLIHTCIAMIVNLRLKTTSEKS